MSQAIQTKNASADLTIVKYDNFRGKRFMTNMLAVEFREKRLWFIPQGMPVEDYLQVEALMRATLEGKFCGPPNRTKRFKRRHLKRMGVVGVFY